MKPRHKKHKPGRFFVTGSDCLIFPLKLKHKPHSVHVRFIDAECIVLPGCNPHVNDTVHAVPIHLPDGMWGIKICWTVIGTREIEWYVTELTF